MNVGLELLGELARRNQQRIPYGGERWSISQVDLIEFVYGHARLQGCS